MRREFLLPEDDVNMLEFSGYQWETIKSQSNWVLIHNYSIPQGYNVANVSIALRIDSGYPASQIDMVYFSPFLHRLDGKPIRALANQTIEGNLWQRWSRHRTSENPWRLGVDGITSHLLLVNYWLEREFNIR